MYEYGSFSYSVDKIKIKGKLDKYNSRNARFPHHNNIRAWCECFLPEWIECVKAVDNCFNAFKYRYAYTLRIKGTKEGTFQIMEWYNGDYKNQKEVPEQFLIEYNPNKEGNRIYKEFTIYFIFKFTDIVQFDLAYDIPGAKASDVFVDTRCDVMTYGTTYNRTTYIAPKEDGSGRVKIYSKDLERDLHGIELPETLRIEVTIKGKVLGLKGEMRFSEELYKLVDRLNSVKIKCKETLTEDWKLFALSCLTPEQFQKCLGLMTSKTKAKYKEQIQSNTYYTLEIDAITLAEHILTVLAPWQERMKI